MGDENDRWAILGIGPGVAAVLLAQAPVRAATPDAAACSDILRRFESQKADLQAPQVSALLFSAADNGCDAVALRLIEGGASVAARDRLGGTALTHAARGGHAAVIKVLVQHGADIDQRTVADSTPLYVAAEQNRLEAAEALIGLGANAALPGRSGVTPLSAAAFNGSDKIVELLLAHGADPKQRDATGKTPLLYAAARGFGPIVTRLLGTGLDVNARYGNDLTVLMWAAGYANDVPADDGVAIVRMLLDKGAAIDAADDRGRTAMMTAAELGHDEVVDLLLRRGAKPDAPRQGGQDGGGSGGIGGYEG